MQNLAPDSSAARDGETGAVLPSTLVFRTSVAMLSLVARRMTGRTEKRGEVGGSSTIVWSLINRLWLETPVFIWLKGHGYIWLAPD